jgi:hypothetical protein
MSRLLAVIISLGLLAFTHGCGMGDKVRARNAMEASQAAYERCLAQHPDDPSQCEAWRRAYEAAYRAYQEAGTRGGPIPTAFIEIGPKR